MIPDSAQPMLDLTDVPPAESAAPAPVADRVTDVPITDAAPADSVTDGPEADASAPPRREPGVRTRAGNAMERTRAAVLDGAARAVEKHGARKATMGDIAVLAGIAKGTLYNHFRAKDAVYAAALDAGISGLAEECALAARDDLVDALALAAERIGGHPALRRLAADEPLAFAAVVTPADTPAWELARAGVHAMLEAAGRTTEPAAVEVVLRWLVSFVADAGVDVAGQAALVAAAIPPAPALRAPASGPASDPDPALDLDPDPDLAPAGTADTNS